MKISIYGDLTKYSSEELKEIKLWANENYNNFEYGDIKNIRFKLTTNKEAYFPIKKNKKSLVIYL